MSARATFIATAASPTGGRAYLHWGTLRGVTITQNAAIGGAGGTRKLTGSGLGGGLYVGTGNAALELDAFTIRNTTNNAASTSARDIFGSYTTIV